MSEPAARYTFKADPHSSHSVILRWLGDGGGRRVLDVGASHGLLSQPLTERGWRVTGIEGDPVAARVGEKHCEAMLVADLNREIPEVDGPFDALVYGDVLEHLVDPLQVFRTLNRGLAPGGDIIVSIPNIAHLWMRLSLLAGRFDYADRGLLDRGHLRFFTRRSLKSFLADAGLRIIRATATPVPIYQVVPPRFHSTALAAVHAVSAATARALPTFLAYQFVVLARPPGGGDFRP